jgi:hypothetical protein
MIRHIAPLTLTALLAASSIACEKPGATERQKEQQASEQAAQTKNSDFEKTRANYRHSRISDLGDIDKRIANLEAKENTATGKTKADLEAEMPAILAQRDAYVRVLQNLDTATASTWDDAKANADRKWDSLKDAVSKAESWPQPKP